jgi:hypothetical protein
VTPIIIVLVIATLVAIGAYQLVINKYYWGPKGPPKGADKKSEDGLHK